MDKVSKRILRTLLQRAGLGKFQIEAVEHYIEFQQFQNKKR